MIGGGGVQKKMYEQKDCHQSKQLEAVKHATLDWWDMPPLRKQVEMNSKIKQLQQILISFKNIFPFKKKLNKVKIASDKTDTYTSLKYLILH